MRKKVNVIQINGIKGILFMVFIGSCLAAGFIAFPGLVCMKLWNIVASHFINLPFIGILQGILLWGILAAAYYTFRREKAIVCIRSPKGLSEEELKAVFENLKQQTRDDVFVQSMLKSRDTELKLNEKTDDENISKSK